jgi:hypothetical protein
MENKVRVRKKVEERASFFTKEASKCGIQINPKKPHFKKKMQVEESAILSSRNIFASWLRRALFPKFPLDRIRLTWWCAS